MRLGESNKMFKDLQQRPKEKEEKHFFCFFFFAAPIWTIDRSFENGWDIIFFLSSDKLVSIFFSSPWRTEEGGGGRGVNWRGIFIINCRFKKHKIDSRCQPRATNIHSGNFFFFFFKYRQEKGEEKIYKQDCYQGKICSQNNCFSFFFFEFSWKSKNENRMRYSLGNAFWKKKTGKSKKKKEKSARECKRGSLSLSFRHHGLFEELGTGRL